jgi:hypothetical protein
MSFFPCALYDLFSPLLTGVFVTTRFFCSVPRISLWRWCHVGAKEVPRAERHLALVCAFYEDELMKANVKDLVYV